MLVGPVLSLVKADQVSVLFAFKASTKVTLEVWKALAPPPANPPASSTALPPDRPPLRFGLASDVPDRWLPLIPEAAGDRLTRYWMGALPSGLREQEIQREGRRLTRRPAGSSGLVYHTSESR
jgi:hypothetical protein